MGLHNLYSIQHPPLIWKRNPPPQNIYWGKVWENLEKLQEKQQHAVYRIDHHITITVWKIRMIKWIWGGVKTLGVSRHFWYDLVSIMKQHKHTKLKHTIHTGESRKEQTRTEGGRYKDYMHTAERKTQEENKPVCRGSINFAHYAVLWLVVLQ